MPAPGTLTILQYSEVVLSVHHGAGSWALGVANKLGVGLGLFLCYGKLRITGVHKKKSFCMWLRRPLGRLRKTATNTVNEGDDFSHNKKAGASSEQHLEQSHFAT